MKINRFNLKLSSAIFCLAAIFCFSQLAAAQSGRRLPKQVPSPQLPAAAPTTSSNDETPIKIEHLLIAGEIQDYDSYEYSIYLSTALDYCLSLLKRQPNLKLKAEVGGKMNFKEAQEIAKKTTNTHILWIGFVMENLGNGNTPVKYANFTILKPKTGEKLFIGRVDPEKVANNGGVMGTPSGSKQSGTHDVSQEIIYRMLRWGWLSN